VYSGEIMSVCVVQAIRPCVCVQLLYCKVGRTITISTGGLFVCLCLHTNEHMYSKYNCLRKVSKVCPSIRFLNSFFKQIFASIEPFYKMVFFWIFFYVRYSTLLHLSPPQIPLRWRMLGSNPGLLGHGICNRALQSS
jgi:hypothetical protein